METLSGLIPQNQQKLQKTLLAYPSTYVESVGSKAKDISREAISNMGAQGTILRLFFGATSEMPLRGLSYVIAAAKIAELLPCSQLQVISMTELGESINGIGQEESLKQARLLREASRRFLETYCPDIEERVMFGQDEASELVVELKPGIQELVEGDSKLKQKLSAKGSKHGDDYLAYGAAHVVHQETNVVNPLGLTLSEPAAVSAERIISIGCQQEHLFYGLRVKAREIIADLSYVPTAQIFTKHVIPPYYSAKRGEQSLESAVTGGVDTSYPTDPTAERDIAYLLDIYSAEEIKQ